jgi:DNA-binding CsgD family transcriptional regulator
VLFARELIGDALSAGTLAQVHGLWRWSGGLGVAPRLRENVAARLGVLSRADRYFLEVLSVGEPLNLMVAGRFTSEVSIPDLERRNLIVVDSVDQRMLVRLGHPLFGEALRAAMPASLHRQISHELAEAITGTVDRQPSDTLRLALWLVSAGEPADPSLLSEAARTANTFSDHELAERLARASVDGGGGFGAKLELGRALLGQGRMEETESVLTPLLGTESSDADRERLADTLSQAVGFGRGRISEALTILESVERTVTDAGIRALLQGQRATFLVFASRFAEAAELGLIALDSVKDEAVRLRSLAWLGASLVMSGRVDEALALNNGDLEPALRLQDRLPRAPEWVVSSRCTALFFAGRHTEALGFLDRTMAALANLPPRTVQLINVYRGRILLCQGRVRHAARLLNDAVVTLLDGSATESSSISDPRVSWALALAAEAQALLGQHDQARKAAAEAISFRKAEITVHEVDELRALAWVDAQDGRISSAIDQLSSAADLAATRGQRAWEILILEDLLRLGEPRVAERARRVAGDVDGAWASAIAAHALGVLSAQTVAIETAAKAFAALGSSLVAAELWATASAAHQREGLPARAAQAARNSARLAELCERARTAPLEWAAAPLPLSRRERETATLAASGATNAQIAAQLSVSVRTVESHLYTAFAKLGVTDRTQLVDVLGQE